MKRRLIDRHSFALKKDMAQIIDKALPKREARESAFLIVFEKLFSPDLTFDDVVSNNEISDFFNIDGFTKNLVNSVFDNLEMIDGIISKHLIDWTFDRISNVSKSLLRLGTAELKFRNTDSKVVFNEMVLLAKKYSDQKDASFVNGILASIETEVRG